MRPNAVAQAISLLFILAPTMAAQRPTPPTRFEIATCTVECCGFGTWRANTRTIAFVKRDTASANAFVIQPNDSVVAMNGIVEMLQPAVVTAVRSRTMEVSSYPKADRSRTITVSAGDTIYTLFESAEETDAIVWYRGSIYESPALYDGFTQLSPLRNRWWVRVRNRRRQVGWILDPQDRFDGPGDCR